MSSFLNTKEIGGIFAIFCSTYFILYLDAKINNKCDCDKYKLNAVSIKVPLLISLISLIVYKLMEKQINDFFAPNMQIKQNIITDMVDF
jgi:hypothetical protein